jgi:hypothetical protein
MCIRIWYGIKSAHNFDLDLATALWTKIQQHMLHDEKQQNDSGLNRTVLTRVSKISGREQNFTRN